VYSSPTRKQASLLGIDEVAETPRLALSGDGNDAETALNTSLHWRWLEAGRVANIRGPVLPPL
jgi:hypothetical protein